MDKAMLFPCPDFFPPALCQAVRTVSLRKDKWLFRRGDAATDVFFVQSGELLALRPQFDGSTAVMLRARAGEFFAEAALSALAYNCDALCQADSTLLALPIPTFRAVLQNVPEFTLYFSQYQAVRLQRQCCRLERLSLKKADDRVLHLLACEAGADGWLRWPGTVRTLAEELALDPATLSRTLSALERAGKLQRQGSWLARPDAAVSPL
jgi:CRP/FNR family transcriptional regulator, dissimilatory nitrate respiration regulator